MAGRADGPCGTLTDPHLVPRRCGHAWDSLDLPRTAPVWARVQAFGRAMAWMTRTN